MDLRIMTPEEFEQQLLDGPPGSLTLLLHNYRILADRVQELEAAMHEIMDIDSSDSRDLYAVAKRVMHR